MNLKKYYENYWSRLSPPPISDPTTNDRKRLLLQVLNRYDPSGRAKKILDVGCGEGEFAEFIAGHGFEVFGIDVAGRAIERARKRCPMASLHVGSVEETLAFPSGFFDAVWCTEVLEHLFDVSKALGELNRVLKERGLLILTTPYHGLLKNVGIALLRFERHFDVTGSHIRFFTKRSLSGCMTRAGFETLWWSGVGRMWPLSRSIFLVSRKVGEPSPSDYRDADL